MIGQDHVTQTLAREIVDNKVAHAYLFAGPRGTGKTTTARLLAKALNCTDRQANGEPCNDCDSCDGVTRATSIDVIELDAASHNKVEDIREIRVNVGTVAAAGGAHRIYILDEAHMLSRAAGNALLKTLEEPPAHVVFILATTAPYKVLDTIRSRCQRFDFHPVGVDTLVDYLADISRRESFTADNQALSLVASHARGSVRDALSLLEQIAALGAGTVDTAGVTKALGLPDSDVYATLARAIVEQDAPAALGLVAHLASQGTDLRRFIAEAVSFFRGVFLAQYAPHLEEVADESSDTLAEWRKVAETMPVADVLRSVDQLAETLLNLRQGREERLVVELAVLRLTRPEIAPDMEALDIRMSRLEGRVRELIEKAATAAPKLAEEPPQRSSPPTISAVGSVTTTTQPQSPASVPTATSVPTLETDDADAPKANVVPVADETRAPESPPVAELTLSQYEAMWPSLVARIRDIVGPRRHALLKEAVPAKVNGGELVLAVPEHLAFHLEQLSHDDELIQALGRLASGDAGGTVTIRFEGGTPGTTGADVAESQPSGSGRPHLQAVKEPDPVPERAPDRDDLFDAGEAGTDPTALVQDILGGEIVDE